ncbi:MAG: hypothetical protein Q8881_04335, partial [Sweet potato little leaf phytoplasma]|nr:hypothetical protein [Sweet potato little leaf phytoplasma]
MEMADVVMVPESQEGESPRGRSEGNESQGEPVVRMVHMSDLTSLETRMFAEIRGIRELISQLIPVVSTPTVVEANTGEVVHREVQAPKEPEIPNTSFMEINDGLELILKPLKKIHFPLETFTMLLSLIYMFIPFL